MQQSLEDAYDVQHETDTCFLYNDFTHFIHDFELETYELSQESDAFSYITQDFEAEMEMYENDPVEDIEMIQFYFDQRLAASAA
jgi:hemerythrin-like domain-containing protein